MCPNQMEVSGQMNWFRTSAHFRFCTCLGFLSNGRLIGPRSMQIKATWQRAIGIDTDSILYLETGYP
jgi:hypothetical protein